MELNHSYESGFLKHVQGSMSGDVTYIPNPLENVGSVFNIMQSRYTLIAGSPGSGKTSFADYEYVLAPWRYFEATGDLVGDKPMH